MDPSDDELRYDIEERSTVNFWIGQSGHERFHDRCVILVATPGNGYRNMRLDAVYYHHHNPHSTVGTSVHFRMKKIPGPEMDEHFQ